MYSTVGNGQVSQNRAEESGQCVSPYHKGDTGGENHEVSLRLLCSIL